MKHNTLLLQVIIVCALTITSSWLLAADPQPSLGDQQRAIELIQLEEIRRQEELNRQRIEQQSEELKDSFETPSRPTLPNRPQETLDIDQSDEHCQILKRIQYINAEDFPVLMRIKLKLHSLQYTKSCVTMTTMNQAVQTTNKLLFNNGYVTSRAHMIAQDTSDGVFDIAIVAGMIKNYELDGLSTWQAALTMPAGLLNHHYLNNGLDNLKMLRSNQPSLKILPGEVLGESTIELNNQRGRFWYGAVNLRNDHSNSVNRPASNVSINATNLLRSNDLLSLSVNESLKERSLQKNRSLSSSLSIPIRRSSWKFDVSKSEFFNFIEGNNIVFRTSGVTRNLSLLGNYLLYKDNKHTWSTSWNITRKADNNVINDAAIDVQSGITRKQTSSLDYKASLSEKIKAGVRSEKHEGTYTGYDVTIGGEDSNNFKRYLHQANINYRRNAWQLGLDTYLQESRTPLLSDQSFSLYTTFIPGIIFIPAREGKLATVKTSYTFNKRGVYYIPELQLTRVETNENGVRTNLSGAKLKGTLQYKQFSAILEVSRPIITPQSEINPAGNIVLNYSY